MCLHPSVSLNNEKICCEISEDKIAVCEKTAGLRCGKFSDLKSACSKVLVPIKNFQFQDMLNENRFLGTFPRSQQTAYSHFIQMLEHLNSDKAGVKYIIRKIINIAIRTTYYVFCSRNKDWSNPDLMNF